eukprot:m.990372 g.990372  ORF g.990372 m.990372 type:complete len:786 (+) comp24000_c1_seq29:267-2624(+)
MERKSSSSEVTKELKVVHEGYLTKSPPSVKNSGWKLRYFVLREGKESAELVYYTQPASCNNSRARPKGIINLRFCQPVCEYSGPARNYPCIIELNSQSRQYLLSCSTLVDMVDWMKKINQVLDRLRPSPRNAANESGDRDPIPPHILPSINGQRPVISQYGTTMSDDPQSSASVTHASNKDDGDYAEEVIDYDHTPPDVAPYSPASNHINTEPPHNARGAPVVESTELGEYHVSETPAYLGDAQPPPLMARGSNGQARAAAPEPRPQYSAAIDKSATIPSTGLFVDEDLQMPLPPKPTDDAATKRAAPPPPGHNPNNAHPNAPNPVRLDAPGRVHERQTFANADARRPPPVPSQGTTLGVGMDYHHQAPPQQANNQNQAPPPLPAKAVPAKTVPAETPPTRTAAPTNTHVGYSAGVAPTKVDRRYEARPWYYGVMDRNEAESILRDALSPEGSGLFIVRRSDHSGNQLVMSWIGGKDRIVTHTKIADTPDGFQFVSKHGPPMKPSLVDLIECTEFRDMLRRADASFRRECEEDGEGSGADGDSNADAADAAEAEDDFSDDLSASGAVGAKPPRRESFYIAHTPRGRASAGQKARAIKQGRTQVGNKIIVQAPRKPTDADDAATRELLRMEHENMRLKRELLAAQAFLQSQSATHEVSWDASQGTARPAAPPTDCISEGEYSEEDEDDEVFDEPSDDFATLAAPPPNLLHGDDPPGFMVAELVRQESAIHHQGRLSGSTAGGGDGARSELDIVAQLQAQLKGQIKDTYAKIQQRTEDLVPEADADL